MSIRIKLVPVLLIALCFFQRDAVAADSARSRYADNRYTGFILDDQGNCLRVGVDNEFRVSDPCPWYAVPYFVGDTVHDAREKLSGEKSKNKNSKQTLFNINKKGELLNDDVVFSQCYSSKKNQLDDAPVGAAIGILVGRRVPDLLGKTEADADRLLSMTGFSKTVTYAANAGSPGGEIQACPDCGKILPQYSNVAMTVAKTVIPDLTQKTLKQAQAILKDKKLDAVFTFTDDRKDKPDDAKIEFQFPRAGDELPIAKDGQKIYLTFPPSQVSLPDVTGDFSSAIGKLKTGRFPVGFENLSMFGKWKVTDQNPKPGLVEAGSAVTLTVLPRTCESSVVVPPLHMLNFSSARQVLERDKLKIQHIPSDKKADEDDWVVGQFPVAGEKVCPGTTVYAVTPVYGETIYYPDILIYLEITKQVLLQAKKPSCEVCPVTQTEKIIYVPVHDYIFVATLIGGGLMGAAGMALLSRRLRSRPLIDEEDTALVSLLMVNKNPKFHVRPVLDWGVQTIGPNNNYE